MMRRIPMFAALVLVTALASTACGKKKVETPAPAPAPPPAPPATTPPPPPAPAPPPPAAARPAPTEDELFARMTLDELNAKGVLADVFFGKIGFDDDLADVVNEPRHEGQFAI